MKNILLFISSQIIFLTLFVSGSYAQETIIPPPAVAECHQPDNNLTNTINLGGINIPNVQLVNQDGKKVNIRDLVTNKVVAINFIFTTCTTICPPMGANFTNLKKRLQPHIEREDLAMISISIDPVTDTPERLKEWSNKFDPGQGWTLLTGEKAQVNTLLKGLKVFTPLKEEHAPIILIGKEGENNWLRTNALAPPKQLEQSILNYLEPQPKQVAIKEENTPEKNYFTDVKLVNQYGEEMRLYSDLMKDKIVVISPFFLKCTGACPVMNTMMKDLQIYFGDKVGKELHLLSISVDPEHDTPDKVAAYAAAMDAIPGRYYLTGSKENVQLALQKLGNAVEGPEDHKNILMIGNVPTRLWKKANGLADTKDIIPIVESVIQDIK